MAEMTLFFTFQEKAQKVKNKVISAMAYPVIVLIIAMLIMVFLMAFIVPKFQAIFADMLNGKPLPPITVFVISISEIIKKMFIPPYLWITIGTAIVLFVGFIPQYAGAQHRRQGDGDNPGEEDRQDDGDRELIQQPPHQPAHE